MVYLTIGQDQQSSANAVLLSHSEHVTGTLASRPHWGFSCNEVIRYEAGHWSCLLIQRLQLQHEWNRFVTEASQSQGELPSCFQLVFSTEFIVCFYCCLLFLMALLWSGMDITLKRCFTEIYCATGQGQDQRFHSLSDPAEDTVLWSVEDILFLFKAVF